jgi:hypothetical protein
MFLVAAAVTAGAFVRVGYQSLGWGGYWYVDFVAPWHR